MEYNIKGPCVLVKSIVIILKCNCCNGFGFGFPSYDILKWTYIIIIIKFCEIIIGNGCNGVNVMTTMVAMAAMALM